MSDNALYVSSEYKIISFAPADGYVAWYLDCDSFDAKPFMEKLLGFGVAEHRAVWRKAGEAKKHSELYFGNCVVGVLLSGEVSESQDQFVCVKKEGEPFTLADMEKYWGGDEEEAE